MFQSLHGTKGKGRTRGSAGGADGVLDGPQRAQFRRAGGRPKGAASCAAPPPPLSALRGRARGVLPRREGRDKYRGEGRRRPLSGRRGS